MHRGDVLRAEMPGAGGFGQAGERDPEKVLNDVIQEKMTVAHARDEYLVVIDPETLTLDLDATQSLRSREQRVGT